MRSFRPPRRARPATDAQRQQQILAQLEQWQIEIANVRELVTELGKETQALPHPPEDKPDDRD